MPSPGTTTGLKRTHQHSPHPLLLSASTALQNCSTAKWDYLVADLAAASAARQTAVGGGTLENEARVWKRYTEYCNRVGLGHNPFLIRMSRQHKIKIMGPFAVALHQGQFSRAADAPLAHSTVRDTLNLVAATFWDNGRDDPKQDSENNVA